MTIWTTFRYPSSWPIGMAICRLGTSDAPVWIRQVVHRITESKEKKEQQKIHIAKK